MFLLSNRALWSETRMGEFEIMAKLDIKELI